MNEKLKDVISSLNSAQTVSLTEFFINIELETDLNLNNIFLGSVVQGSTIDWKNTADYAGYLKSAEYIKVRSTDAWIFSLDQYMIKDVTVYLNVESTENSKSLISAVMLGKMLSGQTTLPVIILKSDDFISIFLYIDYGTTVFYKKNIIESLLNVPSLFESYPPQMNNITGLDCSVIELVYSISNNSYICYFIESSAPDWTIGQMFILNFEKCKIQCHIESPFSTNNTSFIVSGDLKLNNNVIPNVKVKLPTYNESDTCIIMDNGNKPIPSLSDLSYLFYKSDIGSLLPQSLGSLPRFILKDFCFIYGDSIIDLSSYKIGVSTANNVEWNIIPEVLKLKELDLDFYYSPLSCVVEGVLSLGTCDIHLKTRINLNNDDKLNLQFTLINDKSRGTDINVSDFSIFGLRIFDSIPFIENINFKLYDLFMSVNLIPSIDINHLSFSVATIDSWQILPSIELKELNLSLDIDFEDNTNVFGSLSGIISNDDYKINIGVSIPSSGDWTLSILRGLTVISDDDPGMASIPKKIPGVIIPGVEDILSLFGSDISLTGKLPAGLLLDGIKLTDLLITFPNPIEKKINTAYFELRLSKTWLLTSAFKLKNLIFQCGIDFTGAETTFAFNILGNVSIATIDLSTVVTKTADGSWSFSIALDPDEEVKPKVKDMLSDLLSFNLPAAVPDVEISEMELSGNIAENSDNTYQYKIHITDAWDLEPLTKLNINLEEVIIEGSVSSSGKPCKITGIINLGKEESPTKIQLVADLNSTGYTFIGGLGEGSTLTITDLLEILPDEIPGINTVASYLDSFEISKLDVSFEDISNTTKSSIDIEGGFDFDLFGKNCKVLGIVSFANTNGTWELKELAGEFSILSLRFKIGFLSGIELDLYLPNPDNPDNPDNPEILKCTINDDKSLGISLGNVGIFSLILKLVNLMIPGMKLDFPSPWDKLDSIKVPVELKLNMSNPDSITASITIDDFPGGNSIPLLEINSIEIGCDFNEFDITVTIDGELFGKSNTISFKPISEDPPTPALPMGLLDLRYAGFGRHVSLNEQTNYTSMREVIQKLRDAFEQKPNSVVGSNIFGTLGYNSESDWLIGFDFTVAQFLRLSVIFNDPILYGMLIRLDGPAAGMFSGFEFEILYQRLAAGIGAYRMKLELPAYLRTIELGAVSLTLPFIGIDIYTNGNFKLDLGFPYQSNFERSFALSLFPFYGKGGFYFASLNGATSTSVPRIRNGKFEPVIEFGIGLQVGLGKAA